MEEKLKELLAKMDSKVTDSAETIKNEINTAIKDAQEKTKAEQKEIVEKLENRISEMEAAEKKAAKVQKSAEPFNFKSAVATAWDENIDKIKGVAEGNVNNVQLKIKAVGNMLQSANVSGGDLPQSDRLSGFGAAPSRRVRLLDVMTQRGTTSDKIDWVYQAGKEGAAGQTAEGGAKNQIDFNFVVASESVKKTTAFIKISDEMLADNPFATGAVNDELQRELLKAVENGAYDGDGAGANLRGITTVASAWAANAALALAVDNANEVDVLVNALLQIEIAQEGDAIPNFIFMHPADVAKLKVEKLSGTDKRYVERMMMVGSDLSLDGVPIIPSTLIDAGDFLVGDFSKALLVQREGLRIDIGFDSDDFSKNLRTIRAEWRGAVVVPNNSRSAFVYGDFTTAKAALETV